MFKRAVVVACVLLLGVTAISEAANGCKITGGVDNGDRESWGPFEAECSFPHTQPWGNWGVNTPLSGRVDGEQWRGWKWLDNKFQWNSCTTFFPPPSQDNYNHDNYTSQYSNLGWYTHGVGFVYGAPSTACQYLNGVVYTQEEYSAHIYELDTWDIDDYLTTAVYPEQSFTLTCTGTGTASTCYGEASTFTYPSYVWPTDSLTAKGWAWARGDWSSW